MARMQFGGDLAAWAFRRVSDATDEYDSPVVDLVQLLGGAEYTFWNAESGGTQYTDLVVGGGAASTVSTSDGDDGREVGSLPIFSGPDGTPYGPAYMWADGGTGLGRYLIVSWSLGDLVAELLSSGVVAQLAAHVAERNPHATRVRDLAEVSAASPLVGQVLGYTLAGWAATTIEGVAPVQSVDGLTGAVTLSDLYRRRVLALASGQLTSVLQSITFDHVPATDAQDLEVVTQTHAEDGPLVVAWRNERGMWRLESRRGSLFDHLYLGISRYDADATHGWPFRVERREIDGSTRTHIGGIRWDGRVDTALAPWVDITDIDPDETGNYAASSVVGPAPLQVRLETTDICRLQGRIAAAEIVADEVLFTLPVGYLPLSSRLRYATTTSGLMVPIELLVNGNVEIRGVSEDSGPYELSLDDITYAQVEADQDTGEWAVETVATATPSSTSPLTLSYNGVAGRLYVIVMSTNGAETGSVGVPTDDGSNTWLLVDWAPQAGGTGRRVQMWYVVAASPFAAVSVTIPGAQTGYATLVEATGHDPTTPLDTADADVRGSSTTPAALEITPSGADRLLIGACHANPNSTEAITPDSGWLTLPSHVSGHKLVYRVDAPGGSPIGVAYTLGSASGSGHIIAGFDPAP